MGRPGLTQNRKWRRFVHAIGSSAIARGSLELIWDVCYEAGDDYLGNDSDVELIAQWEGEPGHLVRSLAEAGGEGNAGFIEPSPDRPGWRVHHLFENAPDYVQKRMLREIARNQRGETISSLRSAAGKKGRASQLGQTTDKRQAKRGQTDTTCPIVRTSGQHPSANGDTPAPAPAPSTSSLRSEEPPDLKVTLDAMQAVLNLWKEVAEPAGLPAVLHVEGTRRNHLKARLKEKGWFELFKEALTYAATHPEASWMRGEGARPWKADLDYFLKPGSVLKTVEKARSALRVSSRTSPVPPASPRRCATADAALDVQLAGMSFPEATLLPAGAP